MEKIIITFGICFLLIAMPATIAINTPNLALSTLKSNIKKSVSYLKNPSDIEKLYAPPAWAKGNFTGVWRINILGIPTNPIGWIAGYYQNIGLGQFAAVFGEFNKTNATGALIGIMLWVFFIGGVQSTATGNGTYVAGIGVANETHYYVRLHAIIGPSYYIHVKYTEFE